MYFNMLNTCLENVLVIEGKRSAYYNKYLDESTVFHVKLFLCRTFVAIDGFNCFFYPMTRLKTLLKRKVPPNEVTMTIAAMDITKNDWTNGVVVVTVDRHAVPEDMQESYYPRYLLTKEGFEHLDPFIPVHYSNYSEKEFASCLEYYRDRLWLRASRDIDKELAFKSNCNPYTLMEICTPL